MRILRTLASLVLITSTIACDERETTVTTPSVTPAVREEICYRCGGHKFEVSDETPTMVHEGTTYYFCAEMCKTDFAKDPARYLPKKEG